MSEIKKKLSENMKTFMKSGQKESLKHARSLHAAIRKKEIDDRVDLDDDAIIKIIQTSVKQRQDSIEQFKQGGRDDLVEAETQELQFLTTFLPKQLSDEELERVVRAAIESSGASEPKDMGKVMPVVLAQVQGGADGKRVSQMVKNCLSS
ncbi:MAG: glutamyl-tRNA amidotransferase [Bdellovibrionaceae bacterium]|nr:glutamyl-tRNA amidotransferase [Pseudobdellovibrionaceae bacterium]